MRIYLPQSVAASHIEAVRSLQPPTAVNVRIQGGVCDLDAVRCGAISYACTTLWIRTPFVYPFSCGNMRNEYPGEYHVSGDIDWIWLGADADVFRRYFGELCEAGEVKELTVVVFDRFAGILAQNQDASDVRVKLKRNVMNYNLSQWVAACENMLHSHEPDWGRFAANSVDFHPKLEKHLSNYAPLEPRGILDLGCGVGQTTRSLAARYPRAQVYGMDSCTQAIEVARHHFKAPNLQFLVGRLGGRLPFPDGSLDLIVAVNALMYGENQTNTADEVFRVLSPGGTLMHYSRMLESHMFWDFPKSLLGPSVFQLNMADWVRGAARAGMRTLVRSPTDMLTPFPGFFAPGSSKVFSTYYEQGIEEEMRRGGLQYQPWHSHSLMIHSRHVKDKVEGYAKAAYLDRLDEILGRMPGCMDSQKLAATVGWNATARGLALCRESLEFLAHVLPRSGEMVSSILRMSV